MSRAHCLGVGANARLRWHSSRDCRDPPGRLWRCVASHIPRSPAHAADDAARCYAPWLPSQAVAGPLAQGGRARVGRRIDCRSSRRCVARLCRRRRWVAVSLVDGADEGRPASAHPRALARSGPPDEGSRRATRRRAVRRCRSTMSEGESLDSASMVRMPEARIVGVEDDGLHSQSLILRLGKRPDLQVVTVWTMEHATTGASSTRWAPTPPRVRGLFQSHRAVEVGARCLLRGERPATAAPSSIRCAMCMRDDLCEVEKVIRALLSPHPISEALAHR